MLDFLPWPSRRARHRLSCCAVVWLLVTLVFTATAQSIIISEDVGNPGGIYAMASYSGWKNAGTLTYSSGGISNPADVRDLVTSGGYAGSSGSGNIYFSNNTGSYGFAMEGINAALYSDMRLQFGYRKESGSALPNFSIDYWNGTAWVSLATTNSGLIFNESAGAAMGWYLSKKITLPQAAQIGNLKIRFVKNGLTAVRLDDISITGIMPPVAGPAALVGHNSFKAAWSAVSGTVGYRLDISSDPSFASYLSGYQNMLVTDTSYSVTALNPEQLYYYRVRAEFQTGVSPNSNTVSVTTYKDPSSAMYRTRSSGNFSDFNNVWEYNYTGSFYKSATGAPGPGNPVEIEGGHVVRLEDNRQVKSAVINGVLEDRGYMFTVTSQLSGKGRHLSISAGKIMLAGVGASGISGADTIEIGNLELDRSGTCIVGNTVMVKGSLTLTNGILDASAGKLVFVSDEEATGRLAPVAGGSIVGQVTVERYIPPRRAWRFLSSPVNTSATIYDSWQEGGPDSAAAPAGLGTHIFSAAGTNGLDQAQGYSMFRCANTGTTVNWLPVASTNDITDTLRAGEGFRMFIRGDRKQSVNSTTPPPANATRLRATGTLLTGTVRFGGGTQLGSPVSLPALNNTVGGYSLIGNPYASPVSIARVFENPATTGVNKHYIWAWDAQLNGSNGRGRYVAYDMDEFETVAAIASEVDTNIQTGQAFFIQTTHADPVLEFRETDKTAEERHIFKTSSASGGKLRISLYRDDSLLTDAAAVKYDAAYSQEVNFEDAAKFGNPDENIAIFGDNKDLSIEARPEITVSDTVVLNLWQLEDGVPYNLFIDVQGLPDDLAGYLEDNYTGDTFPLYMNGSTTIPFNVNSGTPESSAPGRFRVIFSNQVLAGGELNISAVLTGRGVSLTWNDTRPLPGCSYDLLHAPDGESFSLLENIKGAEGSTEYRWLHEDPVLGENYYKIRKNYPNGAERYSQTVQINIPDNQPAPIVVYPNPVTGHSFFVQLSDVEEDIYVLKLYDMEGSEVYQALIDHSGSRTVWQVMLPGHIRTGIYELKLVGTDLNHHCLLLISSN